jgi:hypothetical protein
MWEAFKKKKIQYKNPAQDYWHSLTECMAPGMFTRAEIMHSAMQTYYSIKQSRMESGEFDAAQASIVSLVWRRSICQTMKPRRYRTLTPWTGVDSDSSWWTTETGYLFTWTLWI